MRYLKLLALLIFIPFTASAQFFVTGDDPGRLRWNYMDTESYRVIYPQGSDSLARVYARKLEKYKVPVSRTSGHMTGEGTGKIMPVVLHTHNDSNGSVALGPFRMDLYTVPSAYDPEPLPWSTMLSIHESRHITQMQFGLTGKHRPGKWFFGEGWNMLAFLLYPGTSKTEGDAVVAETALSKSGRGRTADFLNYYWVAMDQGDFRSWFKWRFDSQMNYVPTYYALGYMTIGGFRSVYNHPNLVGEALNMVAQHPGRLGCMYDVSKKVTGKKWEQMWSEVCDTMYGKWKKDADRRAPYITSENVLPQTKRYTDYTDPIFVNSDIYAVKSGHAHTPSLVRIDSTGKEHFICSYSYAASSPRWDENSGKLYWSETRPDERWTMQSKSDIRYIEEGKRVKRSFRSEERVYNPINKNGKTVIVRYLSDGHSSLDIIEKANVVQSFPAPDSLQLVECAWLKNDIFATAISENGYGIYCLSDGKWSKVLGPQPVMIKDFKAFADELIFTCDRTGVNELYHFNPVTAELRQKTSTRYGGADFEYSSDGKTLVYTSQTLKGKHLLQTSVDSLLDRKVRFDSLYRYHIAETITRQENELAQAEGYSSAVTVDEKDVKISEPKRYRKLTNLFNVHTWFPAYVSVDNIMNSMSFDPMWQALSLGISAVTQNNLSTAVGEAGYSAHKDPYNESKWRHSGHVKFTYSGLYPIFQFSLDINDRGARQYNNYTDVATGKVYMVDSREMSTPYVSGKISMYVPFNFTSGGWSKGIIPRVSYTITNDRFKTGTVLMDRGEKEEFAKEDDSFVGVVEGKNTIRQQVSGSVRAYAMRYIANSQVYPRWGIGAEAGVLSGLESYKVFSPMGYVYTYGYVPGVIRTQGLKLTAMWQTKLRDKSPSSQQILDILPRGLSEVSMLGSYLSSQNSDIVKLTADYAIPIYIGDVTLGGNVLAIKRLVVYPHFDYTFFDKNGLWSAGLDLTADLNAIITLEIPFSFGLSFSWNGGSAWKGLNGQVASGQKIELSKWFLGPIFNVSF